AGKLNEADAEAARAELARELVRHRQAFGHSEPAASSSWAGRAIPLVSLLVVGLAVLIYSDVGRPGMPAAPLALMQQNAAADAAERQAAADDFAKALAEVEKRMQENPSDIRGWQVLGPAYLRLGRYDDAVSAFRKVVELGGPTAPAQTALAEALIMAANGGETPEVLPLLESAVLEDPNYVRARFFLAAELTRTRQWDTAVENWRALMSLGDGTEDWYDVARNGLSVALARGEVSPSDPAAAPSGSQPSADAAPSALNDPAQRERIVSMVAGLQARLDDQGGSIEEWTRLVRSYVVLNEPDKARAAYEAAVQAFPDAAQRADLDALAARSGLGGTTQNQ
ncbi:MAG TPA: hypothetical protein ENJ68_03975, partial [Devosia sp.]|nr:hypothetical protein [Devosia sp.]